MTMLKNAIYNRGLNKVLRSMLRPFSKVLPASLKFPVNGVFTVYGKNLAPFKMATNPTSCVTKYVFWDGVEGFEYSSVRVFCELARESRVFFDIGSNIGYYSLLASSVRKDIATFAFEPMPSAYSFLEENVRLNGFSGITPVKLALSDHTGKAVFYSIANDKFKDMPQLTGDGGLSASHSGARTKVNFEVDIDTLDHFVEKELKGKKIDLIKLDTEANEHFVLKGADAVLRDHRPIIQCEILKGQVEKQIAEVLKPYHYLYYRATSQGLVQVSEFENNPTNFVDYYLVPEEKKQMVSRFIA